jgi:stress-induced morphogen
LQITGGDGMRVCAMKTGWKVIEPEEIERLIRKAMAVDTIEVNDLTGTRDHYQVIVASKDFAGKLPLMHHRMVNDALSVHLKSGAIHALQLKTKVAN